MNQFLLRSVENLYVVGYCVWCDTVGETVLPLNIHLPNTRISLISFCVNLYVLGGM